MPCCAGPWQRRLPQHTTAPQRRHSAGSLGCCPQAEQGWLPIDRYQAWGQGGGAVVVIDVWVVEVGWDGGRGEGQAGRQVESSCVLRTSVFV